MVFNEARGSQFNVPIPPLSSTPPPLYVLNFKSQLQLSVVNHSAPTTISKIHNKLAPSPTIPGREPLPGLASRPQATLKAVLNGL